MLGSSKQVYEFLLRSSRAVLLQYVQYKIMYSEQKCTTMEHWWNSRDGKTELLGEKPVLVPLHPPQITYGSVIHVLEMTDVYSYSEGHSFCSLA
jgi:hypothetical protein